MKIKIKSKELVKVLDNQKKVNEEIFEIHKVLVEADKKHRKMQYKVQRLKDKGSKILDAVLQEQHEMRELDFSTTMEVLGKETVEVDIVNQFDDAFGNKEEIKKEMLKQKKEKTGIWAEPKMFAGHKKK